MPLNIDATISASEPTESPRAHLPRAHLIQPGSFEAERHFYPRVLNAQLNPVVRSFLNMGVSRLVERYCHLHPAATRAEVQRLLTDVPRWFRWGGSDLFHVVRPNGARHMVVIETNSCPSGQKSMPMQADDQEQAGYRRVLEQAFLPMLRRRSLPSGDLAVIYDKNEVEASGYAATLADLTGEAVHLVPCHVGGPDALRARIGVLEAHTERGEWRPLRAAFRYVTQRPWTRLPAVTRTAVLNPVVACLAGGRNKLLAAKAYDMLNADHEARGTGLRLWIPETIRDVALAEVPMWVERMGGIAVVKNPYSNAGQGVWTLTNAAELAVFMRQPHRYDRFIVQSLIGNSGWSSAGTHGRLFHVGTIPDRRDRIYVADLRMMVAAGPNGFVPVAMYARRARQPLTPSLSGSEDSWAMLGTNLSVRTDDGWTSDTARLLLMDNRDFNRLGLGLDDLIEAYVQTVLSVTAIDRMASALVTQRGVFRHRVFASLNRDPALSDEVMRC